MLRSLLRLWPNTLPVRFALSIPLSAPPLSSVCVCVCVCLWVDLLHVLNVQGEHVCISLCRSGINLETCDLTFSDLLSRQLERCDDT